MSAVQDNLRRLAEHQPAAFGCTAQVAYDQYVPPVHKTQDWIDALRPTLSGVVGDGNVVEVPPALGYHLAGMGPTRWRSSSDRSGCASVVTSGALCSRNMPNRVTAVTSLTTVPTVRPELSPSRQGR